MIEGLVCKIFYSNDPITQWACYAYYEQNPERLQALQVIVVLIGGLLFIRLLGYPFIKRRPAPPTTRAEPPVDSKARDDMIQKLADKFSGRKEPRLWRRAK